MNWPWRWTLPLSFAAFYSGFFWTLGSVAACWVCSKLKLWRS